VVTEESYLAAVSTTNTTDVGTLQELTPGKVTTGFSMLAIPHIIDSSTVILQYSISLSSLDSIDDISSGDQRIQVPTVSTRSVLQRVRMPLGSTLVLAGYEEQADSYGEGVGLFGWSRRGGTDRELIVIAIEVNDFG
jgi:MSHA biogenesis protein MshL